MYPTDAVQSGHFKTSTDEHGTLRLVIFVVITVISGLVAASRYRRAGDQHRGVSSALHDNFGSLRRL